MPGSLSNREIVLRAREVLLAEPDLKLALLFGSAATGTMRTDSDVDIACLFDYPLNADQKMRLSLIKIGVSAVACASPPVLRIH